MVFNFETIEHNDIDEVEKNFIPNILNGKVFHITYNAGYNGILKDNRIRNNKDKKFDYIYGQSEGNFGRVRGYICMFDLRNKNNIFEKNEDCTFEGNGYHLLLQYLRPESFIFFLKKTEYSKLIDWQEAQKAKEIYTKKYVDGNYDIPVDWYHVPYYECWYPNDIDIDLIDNVIKLKYKREKTIFEQLADVKNKGVS